MIRRLHERWRAYTRRRRALLAGGLSLAAVVTVALLAVGLARVSPSWWSPVDPAAPATIARAEKLENALVGHMSLVRPRAAEEPGPGLSFRSESWAIALHRDDANAWLAARLPLWLANQGHSPELMRDLDVVQITFENGRVRIGVKILKDGREQIVGASARPVVKDDGSLWFEDATIEAGRLHIPASWAAGFLNARAERYLPPTMRESPRGREVLEMIAGKRPALREATIRLKDGRRVRLLSVTPKQDRVEFVCRTEKR